MYSLQNCMSWVPLLSKYSWGRHGIILAKSIPAKSYGIRTGETVLEARRKCPDLLLVPPNYDLYRECSAAFLDILREYSDRLSGRLPKPV